MKTRMRIGKGKMKQLLSLLLAAAILVTSVPQMGMAAYAAEQATDAESGMSQLSAAALDTVTAAKGAMKDQSSGADDITKDNQSSGADDITKDNQSSGADDITKDNQSSGAGSTLEDDQSSGADGMLEEDQISGESAAADLTGDEEENKEAQEESEEIYEVTFCASYAVITDVKAAGNAVTLTENKITVISGSSLSFRVSADENYVVTAVKEGETPLTAGEDGVYVIADVAGALTISIMTEATETVSVTVEGENATWLAAVIGSDEESSSLDPNAAVYQVEKGSTFMFTPSVKDGCRNLSVKADGEACMPDSEGSYRFDSLTENLTISVDAVKYWLLHFAYEESEAAISVVGADGKEESYNGTDALEIDDKQSLKFKVTPGTYSTVKSVTFEPGTGEEAGEEETGEPAEQAGTQEQDVPIASKDGYYELANIQSAGTIRIVTALPENVNTIRVEKFQYMYSDGSFDLDAVEIPITIDGKPVKPGEVFRTEKDKVTIKVDTSVSLYEAAAVLRWERDGSNDSLEVDGEQQLDFSESAGEITMEIKVCPKKQVRLVQTGKECTASLEGGQVFRKMGSADLYVVGREPETILLKVSVSETSRYEPYVMLGTEVCELQENPTAEGNKLIYRYQMNTKGLKEVTDDEIMELRISQKEKTGYFILEGEHLEEAFDLSVSADGQYIDALDSENETESEIASGILGASQGVVYPIPLKAKVIVNASAKKGWKVSAAQAWSGKDGVWGEAKDVSAKEKEVTYQLTASGMDKLTIAAKAAPEMMGLRMKTGGTGTAAEKAEPVKGIYYVKAGESYMPEIEAADFQIFEKITGEIKNGKRPAATVFDNENRSFTVDAADAGKTLTAALTYQGETFAVFKICVYQYISEIKVNGVSGQGVLKQQIGSEMEYAITVKKPRNALEDYKISVSDEESGIAAYLSEENTLVVNTENAALAEGETEKTAIITITAKNGDGYAAVKGGTITVKATVPKLPTPQIKLLDSDDVSLTLQLTAKGVQQKAGNLRYLINATAREQGKEIRPATIEKYTSTYAAWDGDTQIVRLAVNSADAGKGVKWSFDVTAKLIYQKGSYQTEGGEKQLKNASTKTPCYETKLKFKQNAKSKKLYTGQTTELGMVQYSKNTTFKGQVQAADMTPSISEGEKLKFTTGRDNKIYVEVPEEGESSKKLVGTHEVWIFDDSLGGYTTVPSYIKIKVTVLRGIQKLMFKETSETLYKPYGKAASMKLELDYSDSQKRQPAVKKVTWSVKDSEGYEFQPGDPLYGMIAVKNGTITVNKKYVVSSDPEENEFSIRAEAADYPGNMVYAVWNAEIVSKPEAIGEAVLLGEKEDVITVAARDGDTITAEVLGSYDEVWVAVKRAGTGSMTAYPDTGDTYSENFLGEGELKYTVSGQGIVLNEEGTVEKLRPVKKATVITVTTKDGSRQSAKLRLYVKRDEDTDLGLYLELNEISEVSLDGIEWDKTYLEEGLSQKQGERVVNYRGNYGSATINVCVTAAGRLLQGDSLATNASSYQYKLGAKNAVLADMSEYAAYMGEDDADMAAYMVVLEKQDAVISLTDTVSGKKLSYRFHNTSGALKAAPRIKAESIGIRAGYGEYDSAEDLPQLKLTLPGRAQGYQDTYLMLGAEGASMKKDFMCGYQLMRTMTQCFEKPLKVEENGTITIPVGYKYYSGSAVTNLLAGTCKLSASLGTKDANGKFVQETKPATFRVVIKPLNKVSLRLNSSCTLKQEAGAAAEVIGKSTPSDLCCSSFETRNVLSEGGANHFTDYFEAVVNSEKTGYILKVKEEVTAEQLAKIDKKDLTGYVVYTLYTKDGMYTNNGVSKVTVKWSL